MDSTPEEIRKRYEELAAPTLAAPRVALMAGYVQHGQTTTLEHVAAVAYLSLALVRKLGIRCDERALVRGALLHDYCLYDWHDHNAAPDAWHGFPHPRHALRNAEADFPDLTPLERDIIAHHMFPLVPSPPRHVESLVVSLVDKACSTVEVFAQRPWATTSEGGAAC